MIRHGPDDYKTGRDYGVRPPMVIHPKFYPMLEDFVENQRQSPGRSRARDAVQHAFRGAAAGQGRAPDTDQHQLPADGQAGEPAPGPRHDHHAPAGHGRERARARGAGDLHGPLARHAEGNLRQTDQGGEGGARHRLAGERKRQDAPIRRGALRTLEYCTRILYHHTSMYQHSLLLRVLSPPPAPRPHPWT